MNHLARFYRGKTVLVTGHTGFKGVWLTAWLKHMGARVIGYSLAPPSELNSFEACRMDRHVVHIVGDIGNTQALAKTLEDHQPEIVFHLAAQPLVRRSYDEPASTYTVNVIGTVNVLELARQCASVKAVISVTSDKCYRNQNWYWGYREDDELGGFDPYSSSKACAELVVSCLSDRRYQTAAGSDTLTPIASARAGNVIGGGDWAEDRIIPDLIRAIKSGSDISVRNPSATRPWQHVLEPLSGYLWLALRLYEDPEAHLGGWNFGPKSDDTWTVKDIVEAFLERWESHSTRLVVDRDARAAESQLLQLDCSKANQLLNWRAIWGVPRVIDAIVEWYQLNLSDPGGDMYPVVLKQIDSYVRDAAASGLEWANPGDDEKELMS